MKTVIVTGTSSGIGLDTVVALASQGWRVFATMRNTARSGPLETALADAGVRNRVEIAQLDVTDAASIGTAVEAILSKTGGKLDAVVHNAGVAVGGAFEDIPDDQSRHVMETNFFGVVALTRALMPTFRKQRHGRVLIVSSDAAFMGQPGNAIYCASKWAVEGWAEAAAHELGLFGIEVVLVEPGPYRTPIWENSPHIMPPESPYHAWSEQLFKAADEHTERTARDPVEVARVIVKALDAERPRFRYPVGPLARITHAVRGKIPSRLMRRGVSRLLGLNRIRV